MRAVVPIALVLGCCWVSVAEADLRVPPNSDVVQKRVTSKQQTGVTTSLDVTCPAKTHFVGSGWFGNVTVQGGFLIAEFTEIHEARRISARTMRLTVTNLENPDSKVGGNGAAEAIVYCDSVEGGVTEVSATGVRSNSNNVPSTATATCRRGRVAISGGFSMTPAPGPGFAFPSLYESYRSGRRSWTVSAVPFLQREVQVTSYVYCAKGRRPPVTRQATGTNGGARTGRCGSGLRAHAGGFRGAPGIFVAASQSMPAWPELGDGPFPVYNRWGVGQFAYPWTAPEPLTGYAYCS